jgi:hypothetical protein
MLYSDESHLTTTRDAGRRCSCNAVVWPIDEDGVNCAARRVCVCQDQSRFLVEMTGCMLACLDASSRVGMHLVGSERLGAGRLRGTKCLCFGSRVLIQTKRRSFSYVSIGDSAQIFYRWHHVGFTRTWIFYIHDFTIQPHDAIGQKLLAQSLDTCNI